MKNILASIGIGNATVDTVLPSPTVRPGQTVDAEVRVEGGSAEQEVGAIRFEIETRYRTEDGHREADVHRFTVTEDLTIEPDTDETFPVEIEIPYGTPVTMGNVEVWVETELDIDWAVDPEDTDYLDVQPSPRLQAAFDAMEQLGFSFHTAECEADPYGRYGGSFVQEFEFRPTSGPFRGDLDEVELVVRESAEELTLFVEVDRRGGLLSELADTDETKTSTTVTEADAGRVREDLRGLLERHA
jgi:sporulation-control protein